MEDFFYAGGLPGLMSRIKEHLHLDVMTVTGKTLGENIARAEVYNDDVIRTVERSDLCRGRARGAQGQPRARRLRDQAAAPASRASSSTPARRWCSTIIPSMKKAIDDPDLDVTADHVLILRNAGPQGGPGMPEWGMLPIPTKLVKQGVRDMVRLSDARMSGTSYGACILHVSPESYIGGPLALVQNGDMITLDVDARTINLDVSGSRTGQAPRRMEAAGARASSAAMAGCSPGTSSRPMKAATSISSKPASARRSTSRRFTEFIRHSGRAKRTAATRTIAGSDASQSRRETDDNKSITGRTTMTITRRNMLAAAGAAAASTLAVPRRRRAIVPVHAEPALSRSGGADPRSVLREIPDLFLDRRAGLDRHALGRRAGLFPRGRLSAVLRHPQQPDHEVRREDQPDHRVPQPTPITPTATRGTARAASSPASIR